MGSGKTEAARKERQGKGSRNTDNVKIKGENFYRDAKKIKTLNMFKEGKAQRDASGKITKAAAFQSRELPKARVEPDRRWFGNTRVISQGALSSFRQAVEERASDPYQVLLKSNKIPLSLIQDGETKNGVKQHRAKIAVGSAPFGDTFGPKSQRKRVKLGVGSLEELAGESVKMHDNYLERLESTGLPGDTGVTPAEDPNDGQLPTAREPVFSKGQSKRIFNELYKTIDSSDVIIQVLDARDPEGTRCRSVEKYLREEAGHKHLVFLLNKCDLVPTKVAAAWVRHLSKERPTLAFHASITNSFGKGSLISLLRQFSTLHPNRKQISVGFIGYPNTGKSSIINTLRRKAVCTAAPIPGETKVWQYITLMKRVLLIDAPGIVPPSKDDSEEDILLRGAVRVEKVDYPSQYVAAVLQRVQPKHIERTYGVKFIEGDAIEFLSVLARKGGRLLKGGEPDVDGVARMVLNDFLRGKIPWFIPPPGAERKGEDGTGIEGKRGALGEMGSKKRKLDDPGDEKPEDVVTARRGESFEPKIDTWTTLEDDGSDFSGFDSEQDADEEGEEAGATLIDPTTSSDGGMSADNDDDDDGEAELENQTSASENG
ncbi:MAG: hypothetical protein Q9227_003328 [Pyrenula ochraceoflavens]